MWFLEDKFIAVKNIESDIDIQNPAYLASVKKKKKSIHQFQIASLHLYHTYI